MFEWLLLQDIYGNELFPTTSKELDILKYKSQQVFDVKYIENGWHRDETWWWDMMMDKESVGFYNEWMKSSIFLSISSLYSGFVLKSVLAST